MASAATCRWRRSRVTNLLLKLHARKQGDSPGCYPSLTLRVEVSRGLGCRAGWGVENSLMGFAGDLGRESAISSVQLCVRESPLFDQLFKPV
jgi:hypothetical protein